MELVKKLKRGFESSECCSLKLRRKHYFWMEWLTVLRCNLKFYSVSSSVSLVLKKADIYSWPFAMNYSLNLGDKFIKKKLFSSVFHFTKDTIISRQLKSQNVSQGHYIENQY